MAITTEGSFYITDVTAIELEKVVGDTSEHFRLRIKNERGKTVLSFGLWGEFNTDDLTAGRPFKAPALVITEKDERTAPDVNKAS